MTHDLERFVAAQAGVYPHVLEELRRGRKTGHWMWFVFPQLAGLGRSAVSQQYALASLDEARAYLEHPVLGARLRECTDVLLRVDARSAAAVMGDTDALKLRSCMTLFHRVAPDEPRWGRVLARWYGGVPDPATDALLAAADGADHAPGALP